MATAWTCQHCGRRMTYHTAQNHLKANHSVELRKALAEARKHSPLMEQVGLAFKGRS